MQKDVSCRVANALLRYVAQQGGDVRQFLEGFSLGEAHLRDESQWIRVDQCQALFRRAEKYFDKPGICRKIGLQAHQFGALESLSLPTDRNRDARFLFERIMTVGAHLHRVFALHVRRISDAGALIELAIPQGQELFKPDCDFFSGLLESIPVIQGGKPAVVEHLQCAAQIRNQRTLGKFIYKVDPGGAVFRAPLNKPHAYEPAGKLNEDGTIDLFGVLYGTRSCLYRVSWKPNAPASGWRGLLGRGSADFSNRDFRLMEEQFDDLQKAFSRQQLRIENLEEQVRAREAEMRQMTDRIDSARRQSTEVLSDMSHELRTPINAILGFTDLLAQGIHGGLNEKQKKSIDRIGINTRNLLSILNDVLDFSRLESGKMTVALEPIPLRSLCEETVDTVSGMAQKKGLDLRLDLQENVPRSFVTDKTKFKQILLNLLSNAVKYTDEGSVTLRVMHTGDLAFQVIDTGQGLKSVDKEELFEKFTPLTRNSDSNMPSSGLGLNITRRLVELLGGRIDVRSEWGVGSCFTVTLPSITPFKPSPEEAVDEQAAVFSERAARSVLIVDTDPAVVEFLKLAIEAEGFSVHSAVDPDMALHQARSLRPGLILIEPMLPRKDGWGLVRQLKENPLTRSIPIIIYSVVDEPTLAESLGASISLVKPTPSNRILEVVLHFMKAPPRGSGDST